MKESFQRIIAWMRKHPLLTAVILGVVILLGYLAYRRAQSGGTAGASLQVGQPETGAAGGAAPEAPPLTPVPPVPGQEAVPISFPSFEGYTSSGGGGGGYKSYPASSFAPAAIAPVAPIEVAAPAEGASLLQTLSSDFYAGIGYTPEMIARMQSTPPGEKPPYNIFGGNLQVSEDLSTVTAYGPPSPGISAEAQAALNQEFKNPFVGDVNYPSLTPGASTRVTPAPSAPSTAPASTTPLVAQPGSLAAMLGVSPSSVFSGSVTVRSLDNNNKNKKSSSGGGAKVAAPVASKPSTPSAPAPTSLAAALNTSPSNVFSGSVSTSSNKNKPAPKPTPAPKAPVGNLSQSRKVDRMK
jgi:hypothetical protein